MRKRILTILLLFVLLHNCLAGRTWFTFPRDNMTLSSHIITATVQSSSVDSVGINVNNRYSESKAIRPDGKAEFIGIELPKGDVALKLYAFSNDVWRIQDSILVTVPGNVEKIVMEITPDDLVADGQSEGRIDIELFDKWGNHTTARYPVSLFIEGGEFIGDDLEPYSEGFQVNSQSGRANALFRVGNQAGELRVSALIGQTQKMLKKRLSTYMRPMIMVGQIGGELSYTNHYDMSDGIHDDRLPDEGYQWDGRGAFFAKGSIKNKFLLSMSYDSKVRRRPMMFRRTDPDELLPIYGDTGSLFYENHASTPLFIRLERDKSHLQWSDYNTKLDEEAVFMKYKRSLTGINGEFYTKYVDGKLFLSPTIENTITQVRRHARDTLTPDGTSGFFYLSNDNIIRNSEQITIETHDRYEPDIILSSEDLMRFEDYDIDYDTGEILFSEAILSHDGYRNPRIIVIDYEIEDGHTNALIGGGRIVLHPTENVSMGVTGVFEDYEGEDHNIAGSDITMKFLEEMLTLRGEFAYSYNGDTLLETENQKGIAYIAESNLDANNLKSNLYYRFQEKSYSNEAISTTSRSGIQKMGGDVNYDIKGYQICIDGFDESYMDEEKSRQRFSLNLEKQYSSVTPTIGAEYNNYEDEDTSYTNTTALSKINWQLNTKFSLYAYHRQSLEKSNRYPTESALGSEYHLNGGHTIFGSYGYLNYVQRDLDRQFANIGIKSTFAGINSKGVIQATSEKNDSYNSQAIINVSDRFVITKWLALDMGFENEKAVTGDNQNDHTSVSGTFTLKPAGFLINQKNEYSKHNTKGNKLLVILAASTSNGKTFSVLAKHQYQIRSELGDDLSDYILKKTTSLLGFAIRPIESDWINVLAKLEYESENKQVQYPYHYNNTLTFSIQDIISIGNYLEFTTRYAGKYNRQKLQMDFDGEIYEVGGQKSYTDLMIAGIRGEIFKRVDLGIEGRVLYQRQAGDYNYDVAPEIGIVVMRNIRLGFGWNVIGYTEEQFSGDGYFAKGPYFTADIKLSENGIRLPVIDDASLEDYHRRSNDSLYYPEGERELNTNIRDYPPPDTVYSPETRRFGYTEEMPDSIQMPDSLQNPGDSLNTNNSENRLDEGYDEDSTEPSFIDPGYLRREDVVPPGEQ